MMLTMMAITVMCIIGLCQSLHSTRNKFSSRALNVYSINKRTFGTNMGIPQKSAGISSSPDIVRRRKAGAPQRNAKQNPAKEEILAGRVSVYCLGAGLDLRALRSHLSREGLRTFDRSSQSEIPGGSNSAQNFLLHLTTRESEFHDEIIHVSNAPLYNSLDKRASKKMERSIKIESVSLEKNSGSEITYKDDDRALTESTTMVRDRRDGEIFSKADEDEISDIEWKTREQLLMTTQDIFYFDYGCVVFWGLSTGEEKAAITELAAFTIDPVTPTQLDTSYDTLEFVFDRKANPQRPIRFDRMRLRSLQLAEKMALSYAMAQSSKLFVFESRVLDSVEMTRYLPRELAKNGRIDSSKKALNQQIGALFVEQTEVNLFSSILDSPDFLWDDDEHLPAYQYTRAYLEVDDRVALLNSRLAVIRDLLDVLTGQVADSNSTRLEWIVIWLISVEIIMGIASNPIFAGRRFIVSLLVPFCILAYKRINWAKVLKDI